MLFHTDGFGNLIGNIYLYNMVETVMLQGHVSKTNVSLQRKGSKQKPDGNYNKMVRMQFDKMYCKLDFLLQTHLLLPCNDSI